ncbi:YebC/PmpR family DNA-binding transcriptional regulator, partial [bacterium]|nr:YebC/PmpR family DNA-binding transcriptional regulator [bacterium]
AARQGGGDENINPRLRTAVMTAKGSNMPQANIDRAIKKGTGELPGVAYEEVVYEGYGSGGAAFLIEIVTDNKNRTLPEIRHLLTKNGGSMGAAGSVAWMFEKKGIVVVEDSSVKEDDLMELVLDKGADDIINDNGVFEIISGPDELESVKDALQGKNINFSSSNITVVPKNFTRVEGSNAVKVLKLMEFLENHDDVQNVYSNFDIDDEIINEYK